MNGRCHRRLLLESATESSLISPHLDVWALAAWIGINILVPVLLPLFVLWLFSIPSVTSALAAGSIVKSIGKGELFWAAMGMAAATCYELFALQKIVTDADGYGIVWLVFWIHLGIILGSAIMVGVGSLNGATPTTGNPHIPDRKVFVASIVTLAFTATTYTVAHAVMNTMESAIKDEAAAAARQKKNAIIKELGACLAKNSMDGTRCVEVIK